MNLNPATSLRNEFLLNPQIIYFNHGSFGATPRPVFESYQRWQRELEFQPTEFFGRRSHGLLEKSRTALAEYLGTQANNLAYVVNATTGLNVAAHSLQLQPGDEVLTTDHEYGALDRTWRFLAKKQGFKYINHPIPLPVSTAEAFMEEFWKGVTPRTRVIFISHITSPTALIFPVKQICERARREGILTVIDGAHAPGQIPLNLDELGCDFYSGNLHKWLCAPKGSAFLYARSEAMHMIEPLVVSWGYENAEPGHELVNYVEYQGTRDLSAFLAVEDAINFFKEHDWDTVRAQCHALAVQTAQQIADLGGMQPLSPLTEEWVGQMVSAPLPDQVDLGELGKLVRDEHHIEIPIMNWNGHKLVRCSFQAYISPEDAAELVNAIKQHLA